MEETSAAPVEVEKIDLSKINDAADEGQSSSGYGSGGLAPTTTSWRSVIDRNPDTDRTELQDVMSLEAVLGTTLFTPSQYNQSMEESAKIMMQELNFQEAAVLLEGVITMGCRQQLMLAECYLQTGQERDAKISIDHAARLMTSSLRLRVHDVTGAIRKATENANYVKAMILLQCSPRYAFLKMVPNEAVMFIERRVSDYNRVVRAMVRLGGRAQEIATWFVKEIMLDIMLLFREISGAKFRSKVICETRILTYFGLAYREIGEHAKSLECFQQGLELLEYSFDDHVSKSKIFGTLLQNAGLQFESLGRLDKAESHYLRALEAFTEVEDWESARDERKSVETTTLNLDIVRKKLQNQAIKSEVLHTEFLAEQSDETAPRTLEEELGVEEVQEKHGSTPDIDDGVSGHADVPTDVVSPT